jgi:hypothetical protein
VTKAPSTERPLRRSHRRDADVRTVSRITRSVAALAAIGTAVVGGLAATSTGAAPDAATPVASPAGPVATVPTYAPSPSPSPSLQAPVASSGAS